MDRRYLALVAALATASACEKKPGHGSVLSELVAKPAAVDIARLKAPALFASVPAETPYMIAAFEAIPLEYYAKLKRAMGPAFGSVYANFRNAASGGDATLLLDAIEQELDGKWNAKGLESLGFEASPRFALYGLGVAPIVFRIEVRDDKTVLATIERIAQRAGLTLPPVQTQDGRSYWRTSKGDVAAIVSLADKQLVAAFGPVAEIDKNLALILGSQKPAANMANGKALIDIMVKHGFGPHLVGFVDTRKMITQGMALSGHLTSSACVAEIDRIGSRVPRAVIGYTLLTTSVSSGGAVLELAPDLVTQIEGLRTEVVGLKEALAGKPVFGLGMGIQLDGARKLALDGALAVRRLGEACEIPGLAEKAADAGDSLSRPIPAVIASLTGMVMSMRDITFSASSPMPEKVEAYVALTSTDPKAVFAMVDKDLAKLTGAPLAADGSVHEIKGLPVPFPIHAGVGDRAIVVGIGANGKSLATTALQARAAGKAPFMAMTYDYGKFLELQSQLARATGGADPVQAMQQQLSQSLAKLFGRADATLDVGTHGLVFWGTIEMK